MTVVWSGASRVGVCLMAVIVSGCSAEAPSSGDRGARSAGSGGVNVDGDDGGGAGTAAPEIPNAENRIAQPPPALPMEPAGDGDGPRPGETEICVQDNAEATLELRPIDIIISVDTSGSMGQEIDGVQSNINDNFASIIEMSGIDYQVILLSDNDVCISGSLNPAGCGQSNPPLFHHIDWGIGSDDTWCALLDSYPAWSGLLRPEAFKVFVAITDDSPGCNAQVARNLSADLVGATSFDGALLALDAAQFGTTTDRNYIFHSLVALADNTPATEAYEPTDPIVAGECPTAADNGEGYQHLSQMTGGLRFPVCEGNNFSAVFTRIAEGIVEGSAVACEFQVPAAAADGTPIDRETVEVAYVPGDRSTTVKFDRVSDVADCATEAFFLEGDSVKLCPAACDAVKLDAQAEVQVLFGCDVCAGLDADCGVAPPPDLPPLE